MKIYTSYYYQLRNFPSNLVGLSTAIWPPKYIKLNEKDKRGVWCIDCPPFKPGKECEGLCKGKCNPSQPEVCEFLKTYKQQLDRLDFSYVMRRLTKLAATIKKDEGFKDVDFAYIVFEAPRNKCSERWPIQQWFREHGIEVEEWTKENVTSN